MNCWRSVYFFMWSMILTSIAGQLYAQLAASDISLGRFRVRPIMEVVGSSQPGFDCQVDIKFCLSHIEKRKEASDQIETGDEFDTILDQAYYVTLDDPFLLKHDSPFWELRCLTLDQDVDWTTTRISSDGNRTVAGSEYVHLSKIGDVVGRRFQVNVLPPECEPGQRPAEEYTKLGLQLVCYDGLARIERRFRPRSFTGEVVAVTSVVELGSFLKGSRLTVQPINGTHLPLRSPSVILSGEKLRQKGGSRKIDMTFINKGADDVEVFDPFINRFAVAVVPFRRRLFDLGEKQRIILDELRPAITYSNSDLRLSTRQVIPPGGICGGQVDLLSTQAVGRFRLRIDLDSRVLCNQLPPFPEAIIHDRYTVVSFAEFDYVVTEPR